jgi:GH15 family glucan-1,4-alpha-glucosidase
MTQTSGTGQPTVDAALAELARLRDLPVDDHVAVFDAIDKRLRESLADAAGAAAGPRV